MSEASLLAFENLRYRIAGVRQQVYQAVVVCVDNGWDATLPRISKLTGLPFHSISGRLTELEKRGMVWKEGKVKIDGRTYTRYQI